MSVVYSSCWKSIAFVFWRFPRPVVYSYFDEKLRLYFDASSTQVCEDGQDDHDDNGHND